MFISKVKAPQIRPAQNATSGLVQWRSTPAAHRPGHRNAALPGRGSERTHGLNAANLPGLSWDVSAIPLFPPGKGPQTNALARPIGGLLQQKLTVGRADDPLEREADQIADQVMRTPDPSAIAATRGAPAVQRKCEACEEEEKADTHELARAGSGDAAAFEATEAPAIVAEVLSRPGRALGPATRAFFEPRFGHDFSSVRVHTDGLAAESARSVGALAYTVGNDIVFGSGQYTQPGGRLLAHELTHTIQQRGGMSAGPPGQRLGRVSGGDPHAIQRQGGGTHAPAHPSAAGRRSAVPATPRLGSCRPVQDDLRPTAPWADLQRTYRARCASAAADVAGQAERTWDDIRHGRAPRAPHVPDARSSVDCACAYMPPKEAATAAMAVVLAAGPLAARLYWHFLGASGTPMTIDVADMVARSAGVRAKIRQSIARGGMSGTTRLEQHDYGDRELQFAYGAIDCVQWQAMPPATHHWRSDPGTQLHVSMVDYYEFHPGRTGVSQCAHAACVEAVARGEARNFWTSGDASVSWRDLQRH